MQIHVKAFGPLVQHTVRVAGAGAIESRGLANIAHGAARIKTGQALEVLWVTLATAAQQRMPLFNAQDIANTAWAFATAARSDELLFVALAREAQHRLATFKKQELANTAWAFATAARSDEVLFVALARAAQQ